MNTEKRRLRVGDFEERAAFAPGSVSLHQDRGWPYIPIHPSADEVTSDVPCVECWCLIDGDAALLECWKIGHVKLEPGLYARVEDEENLFWPKLLAVTSQILARAVVEAMMSRFAEIGFPDPLLDSLRPGDGYLKVSDWQ